MDAVLDLGDCLGVFAVAGSGGGAEGAGGDVEEACFDCFDTAVDNGVDGVDDIVDKGEGRVAEVLCEERVGGARRLGHCGRGQESRSGIFWNSISGCSHDIRYVVDVNEFVAFAQWLLV